MGVSEYKDCIDNLNDRDMWKLFERTIRPKYPRLISALEKFIVLNTVDAGIMLRVMAEKARCEHLRDSENRN